MPAFIPPKGGGTLTWIIFLPVAVFIGLWRQRRPPRVAVLLIGLDGMSSLLIVVLV
jgi:hypothetical protein